MKKLYTQVNLKNGNTKTIHVELEDEIADFLSTKTEIERQEFIIFEYKSRLAERRETRRHTSLDRLVEKGVGFRDYGQDIEFVLEWEREYREGRAIERLQRAVFAKYLTGRQAEVFYQFKVLGFKKTKVARNMGITESAVRKLVAKAAHALKAPAFAVTKLLDGEDYPDEFTSEHEERYDVLTDETVFEIREILQLLLRLK
jgi:hypothetical protein